MIKKIYYTKKQKALRKSNAEEVLQSCKWETEL